MEILRQRILSFVIVCKSWVGSRVLEREQMDGEEEASCWLFLVK